MNKIIGKKSKKSGLEAGTLVHVGENRQEKVKITLMDYDEKHFEEKEVKNIEDCFPFKATPTVTWINIDGIHRPDIIEKIGRHFDVHSLVLEDIVTTGQRPKMEDFDSFIFLVMGMLHYSEKEKKSSSEQISIIFGKNYVISFQETVGDVFDPIRQRIRSDKGRIRKCGPDYLAYSLIDAVVDNYFYVLERFGERIEKVEGSLVSRPSPKMLQEIHSLKREMIYMRRAVWPLREVVNGLGRSESKLVNKKTHIFLRDVYDHTVQIMDAVETYRDMLSGMIDLYLSSISNRLNEVMKVLTIIATIFIPLTFIVGIYGMNFRYMPELESPFGYPAVLLVMLGIGAVMLLHFRRKKWI